MYNVDARVTKRDYIGNEVGIMAVIKEEIQDALNEVLLYRPVYEPREFTFQTSDGEHWYARYKYSFEEDRGAVEIENLILH